MNKLKWLVRNAAGIWVAFIASILLIGLPALWVYYEGLWIAFLGVSGIILASWGIIMIIVYLEELFDRLEKWAEGRG